MSDLANPWLDELQWAAACAELGRIVSDAVPRIADRILSAGFYSPAVMELAHTLTPIWSDVEPLLRKALEELQIAWPAREQAAWAVLRHQLTRVATGESSPEKALGVIAEMLWILADPENPRETTGLRWGLEPLIRIYCSYDDVPTDPQPGFFSGSAEQHRQALDRQAVAAAQAWLRTNPVNRH